MTKVFFRFWPPYRLTDKAGRRILLKHNEAQILLALMGNRFLGRELISEVLWPNPDKMPDHYFTRIYQMIRDLREKLEIFGLSIEPKIGFGYFLTGIQNAG